MDIDNLLKSYGLKYEELNPMEKETLHSWLDSLKQNSLTIERIREYIRAMRDAVEQELTKFDLGSKQDMLLKARLRNYMLLEAFLTAPDKAQKQLDIALNNLKKK